jgi:hypothetical protein
MPPFSDDAPIYLFLWHDENAFHNVIKSLKWRPSAGIVSRRNAER